jgi:hypothetical protein
MRRALLLALAMVPLRLVGEDATTSSPAMKEKLQAVIRQQLEAFRRNDYAAAYTFAASAIRAQFPMQAFEKMVRTGYPLIAKSTDVSFGISLDDGERAVVTVRITAGEKAETYQYLLERDGDDWRIGGVEKLDERSTVI